MAAKIFVSYRRDDDPSAAARVRDALAARFGKANIFMDVDNLLAGLRFDDELAKALAACDVFIAIIGTRWLDLLKVKAESGQRDYVCEEIAEALKRKIAVIPARVGRDGQLAPLPRPDDLPPEIRDLVHYQKHDVTHEHFGRDASALAEAIVAVRRHLRPVGASTVPRLPRPWLFATALGALGIGYVGAYSAGVPLPWPEPPRAATGSNGTDLAAQVKQEREARAKAEAEAKRLADAVAQTRREQEARERAERDAAAVIPAEPPQPAVAWQAGRIIQDCPTCPEMVVVPAGRFMMGSPANEKYRESDEGPQRQVTIRYPFAVGKFEVTFAEWNTCVAEKGCSHKPGDEGWGRGKRPVINVSWNDAKQYAAWLSAKTGKSYRLLTEAEWEYAARAGTTTPFFTGATISTKQANFDGNSTYNGSAKGQYRQRTIDVGSFKPNAFGLYDMHGNVDEWVEDCYADSYAGAPTDGSKAPDSNSCSRVLRGGSWNGSPQVLRAADRYGLQPDDRSFSLGFRLARTLTPIP